MVAKVEHHAGELFPRVGFIVTNLVLPSLAVVRFYNKRGTAEQLIKEGKHAVKMTRLSCHRFRSNEVRLWLSVNRLYPGELVAAAGAAQEDRPLVLDQLVAEAREDRRTAGETYALLLPAIGRRTSHAAASWQHAEIDRGAAAAERIANQESAQRPSSGEKCLWGGDKQTKAERNC